MIKIQTISLRSNEFHLLQFVVKAKIKGNVRILLSFDLFLLSVFLHKPNESSRFHRFILSFAFELFEFCSPAFFNNYIFLHLSFPCLNFPLTKFLHQLFHCSRILRIYNIYEKLSTWHFFGSVIRQMFKNLRVLFNLFP